MMRRKRFLSYSTALTFAVGSLSFDGQTSPTLLNGGDASLDAAERQRVVHGTILV